MALDQLSRDLANGTVTRRQALAVLAATAVGALIPFARVEAQGECARRGHPCEGNQDCCGRLVCSRRGQGTAKRCRRRENDDD
jgi:Ion channel inhibitory toxin